MRCIESGKNGDGPDGKTAALRGKEQAIALRKPIPICRGAPSPTIQRRVVKGNNLQQAPPFNMHKIPPDIEFQDMAGAGIIAGNSPDAL